MIHGFFQMTAALEGYQFSEVARLVTETADVGQATLPLPDGEGALERLARLVDPARALEHCGEVLVGPALKPRVVRLGLSGGDARAGKSLGLVELAAPGEDERLDGGGQRPLHRPGRDGLRLP